MRTVKRRERRAPQWGRAASVTLDPIMGGTG